jgi:Rrf2 family protein
MKITAQEEYGLRCLLRLARADGQALTIPEVASAEQLSQPYVAKLLSILRQAGFIESVRGRSGGYHLARPASDIHLGAVMRALGEPLFEDPTYCERHASPETNGACVHQGGCSLRVLWTALEEWLRYVLDHTTLADLLLDESKIAERLRSQLPSADLIAPLLTLGPAARH